MFGSLLAFTVLVTASSVSLAAPSVDAVAGVYDNLADFEAAVSKAQTSTLNGAELKMTDEEMKARRREISRSLSNVTGSERDAVAKQYGMLLYDPNMGDISIQSDSADVAVPRVVMHYDTITREKGFQAQVTWRD